MIWAKKNYKTHDKKLLAIVMCFKHWRHYLKDNVHLMIVLTDHNNLKKFIHVQQLNDRQVRWTMKLIAFNFSIEHWFKKSNLVDASSRQSNYYEEVNEHAQRLLSTLQSKLNVMTTLQASAASELFKIIVDVLRTVNLHTESETSKSRIANSWSIYILDKKNTTATQRILRHVTTIIIKNENSYKNNV